MADTAKKVELNTEIPEIQEFLKAGVQFGHQIKKWNPKMERFIFDKRDDIHIIDLSKSIPMLIEAMKFLKEQAAKGDVLFVGTKRQASDIVKAAAIDAGAHYIVNRWPGGLLTNFKLIQRSLKKFNELESDFEKGIEDRTKFEVSQMKKDWIKMNRLYEGIKQMDRYPSAVVIVDAKFEYGAVREANSMDIPVISLIDTNTDPDNVDYPIPANDDAIKSIRLIVNLLAEAVKEGNAGKGVKHSFTDFATYEVELRKTEVKSENIVEVESTSTDAVVEPKVKRISKKTDAKKTSKKGKGMLEKIQKEAETKKIKKAEQTRKK